MEIQPYPNELKNAENKFKELYELILINFFNEVNIDTSFDVVEIIEYLLDIDTVNIFTDLLEDTEQQISDVLERKYNITIE